MAGRWTTNNFEKNASIGGDNNQVNVRADYNMSQNNRIIGRYTRFDSTNLPVDVYGNGQTNGDPYSPEHFITTQVMVADTYTFNSSTVLDVRFGVMRWDYDRTPGNLGTDPVSTFGLPVVPYGQIPERSDGVPPTLPSINAGSNQVIGTGLIYADDYTYSFTPTLTKIMGAHTLKAGANILNGEVNYFQNNNVGGTFTFANNPTALDGTSPRRNGRSVRVVSDRSAHRRDVPVIEFQLWPLPVPGVLCRGFLADDLPADREPRNAPGEAGCVLRDGRPPRDLQPRLGQPASGRDGPTRKRESRTSVRSSWWRATRNRSAR